MTEMYPRALDVAKQAHFNQTRRLHKNSDKKVIAYINHPMAVAAQFEDDFDKTVAILHDVIEDAPEFSDRILKEFPKEVFNTITIISRLPKETYFDFIMRIKNSNNETAIRVKIEDLNDNSKTVDEGATADKYRFAKYILLTKLAETKKGMNEIYDKFLRE